MTTTPKYPVESTYHPVLIRGADNKQLYACGGGAWLPVPDDTTMENVHLYMKKKEYIPNVPVKKFEVKIKNKTYKVELWKDNTASCNCTGFRYRKQCKHTEAVLKKVKRGG